MSEWILTSGLSGNYAAFSVEYFLLAYTCRMNWYELLFLGLAAATAWFWLDSLKTREIGIRAARQACRGEGLQLLDDTVAGHLLGLARDAAGQLRLRRIYRFEYSDTGDNRRSGSVTMLGHDVELLHVRPHLYVIPNAHETLN